MRRQQRRSFLPTLLGLIVIVALGYGGYVFFKDLDGPVVTISPKTDRVSPSSELVVVMEDPSGIRSLSVGIRKNNVVNEIYRKHFDSYDTRREVRVSMAKADLREGAFELEVKAADGSLAGFGQGNTRTLTLPMRLDPQPPRLSVKTLPPNVRRGGAAVVRYTADEEIVNSGVLVAGYFVPGFRQKDGSYICFFPFPYTMTAPEFKKSVELTATDLAGNVTRSGLTVMAFERKFKSDTLKLTDAFLQRVGDKLGSHAPADLNPLDRYLYINMNLRASNAETLRQLRDQTASAMLWDGAFKRMPRAMSVANFADRRSCVYQGKDVGEYYHLGFDLASVKHDNVPVANNGRVVFVGDLGIYGGLVVVDHGLGLMTLYAHLSEFSVKTGDVVKKGDIIAKTGSTGLAFGDHLHFGVLVGGVEVTPLEWLDPKWIKDNITDRLAQ